MTDKVECMGVIKMNWSDKFIMPMEDASAIMAHFQNAQKLTEKDGVATLVPINEYPQLSLMAMTTFRQIKVNDLLDQG